MKDLPGTGCGCQTMLRWLHLASFCVFLQCAEMRTVEWRGGEEGGGDG